MRFLPFALLLCACASTRLVTAQPAPVLFANTWPATDVRAAVIRSLNHARVNPTSEANGVVQGASLKLPCSVAVAWSETQVVVTPGPQTEAGEVDARCAELATRVARSVDAELRRPEKVARKEAARQRKAQQAAANQAAWAAQAEQQRQAAIQAQQQQAAAAQAAAMEEEYAPPPPPPAPVQNTTVQVHHSTSQVQSTTNVTSNTTYVNAAPAPEPEGPRLQPNTCCVRGKAYLCPNTTVYVGACVQNQGDLARMCPANVAHDRFCPR